MRAPAPLLLVLLLGCPSAPAPDPDPDPPAGLPLRVMTFNGGTTDGLSHDAPPDDGYTSAMAAIADSDYENSLSWNPAEAALTAFLAAERPDVVVFQEIFFDGWCADIVVDPSLDFVCDGWTADRLLQVQRLLGPDYQTACAPGQEDNCAGVLRATGALRDCAEDHCPEGMGGMGPPSGCSNGARVSDAVITLADGRELVLVNVHGTSGLLPEDRDCRVDQFEQVFVDRGDGRPAAHGAVNLVMGDLNTDPFLMGANESSAIKWLEFVGDGRPFHFLSSDASDDGPETYSFGLRIDHIVSDVLLRSEAGCRVAGASPGLDPVMEAVYWDHKPVLCDVILPGE